MNVVENVVRSVNGGCICNVSYSVPASDIRKGATDGTDKINPYWARKDDVRKVVQNCQINLGVIYGNAINGRLDKKELPANFVPAEMKGKQEHANKHKNLCQNMDRTKTYVRYMAMGNKTMTVKYVLDGKDITAELKPFKAIKEESHTQANAGLEQEEQIVWRTLDLANITALSIMGMTISGKIEQEKEQAITEKVAETIS